MIMYADSGGIDQGMSIRICPKESFSNVEAELKQTAVVRNAIAGNQPSNSMNLFKILYSINCHQNNKTILH